MGNIQNYKYFELLRMTDIAESIWYVSRVNLRYLCKNNSVALPMRSPELMMQEGHKIIGKKIWNTASLFEAT